MYCKQDCYTLVVSEDGDGFTVLELMNNNWERVSAWYRDGNLSAGENHKARQEFFDNLYNEQFPPIYLSQGEESEVTVLNLLTRAGMTLDENNFIHSYPQEEKTANINVFDYIEKAENISNWKIDMNLVEKLLSDGYTIRVEDDKEIIVTDWRGE